MLTIQTGNKLKRNVAKKVSLEEGRKIAEILLQEIELREHAIGLAAPQIDIDASVAVVNVKEPIVLINPRIVKLGKNTTAFQESCLSFPDESLKVVRHPECIIEADNIKGKLYFAPANEDDSEGLLESICVQHEIAHLNGLTIHDFTMKPRKVDQKIGRNDKVIIIKNGVEKILKYKKIESYLSEGWKLI